MKLKKGEFNEKLVAGWSLGQVLGYDGCYDSGTCPHGYRIATRNSLTELYHQHSK